MELNLFGSAKQSDILMVVEEKDLNPVVLTIGDFEALMTDNKVKDDARVTKVSVMERYIVTSRKELRKRNGGDS